MQPNPPRLAANFSTSASLASPVSALPEARFSATGRATLEERAGLFVWPGLAGTAITPGERRVLSLYKPSGVVLFRRNLASLTQGDTLVREIRAILPGCVVAIDEEGGSVARLPWPVPRGLPALQMADGGERGVAQARQQALLQALVSSGLGIDCILGPVADVLTNPDNPVMGDRCYGRDAATVAAFVQEVSALFLAHGVHACVKHFPGHGDTVTDTHHGFAETSTSRSTLERREWVPFLAAFRAGVRLCMTAHVRVPDLDPDLPATLSSVALREVLRGSLGFEGLVLSDDLRMKAIALHYGVTDHVMSAAVVDDVDGLAGAVRSGYLHRAAPDALRAGCDVLLSCQSAVLEEETLAGVRDALHDDPSFVAEMETRVPHFARAGLWRAAHIG